jgi:hypothetical protein
MVPVDFISGIGLSDDCVFRILPAPRRIVCALGLHPRELHQRFQIIIKQLLPQDKSTEH